MSYNDIDDWAEENLPPEMYEDFNDWLDDIERNFARHGHYFPKEMVDNLAELWEERFGIRLSEDEIRAAKRYATDKTLAYEYSYLNARLRGLQKRQERRILLAQKQKRSKSARDRMTKRERRKLRSKGKKK